MSLGRSRKRRKIRGEGEERENIEEEEGVTKNAKKRLEELSAVTRVQQNCADMVASTLAKVLPE